MLFGSLNIKEKYLKEFIDFVILETKWQIWKNRNNVKYGNKRSNNYKNLLQHIKEQCNLQFRTIELCNSYQLEKKLKQLIKNFLV